MGEVDSSVDEWDERCEGEKAEEGSWLARRGMMEGAPGNTTLHNNIYSGIQHPSILETQHEVIQDCLLRYGRSIEVELTAQRDWLPASDTPCMKALNPRPFTLRHQLDLFLVTFALQSSCLLWFSSSLHHPITSAHSQCTAHFWVCPLEACRSPRLRLFELLKLIRLYPIYPVTTSWCRS